MISNMLSHRHVKFYKQSMSDTWIIEQLTEFIDHTSCNESEPRHDKTNKVTVRPAKTQISVFAVRLMGS